MVILRPTKKLAASLPPTDAPAGNSDTALGDWYVNRIVVHRKPILLLVSSASLFPMLLPARDVRGLPARLGALVAARLRRFGIIDRAIDAEVSAMSSVVIRPTIDRSVLGIMVDYAKTIPYHVRGPWDDRVLVDLERRLEHTPCHAGRPRDGVVFPDLRARQLLDAKWLAR